jgi:hypothetical protein
MPRCAALSGLGSSSGGCFACADWVGEFWVERSGAHVGTARAVKGFKIIRKSRGASRPACVAPDTLLPFLLYFLC